MIVVGVPIINQQVLTNELIKNFREKAGAEITFILVDNGSNPKLEDWIIGLSENDVIIRNEQNIGVLGALNQIYDHVKKIRDVEYIFYTHNDVIIYEDGWMSKLEEFLGGKSGTIGVAGFYGAKGIGVTGIYQTPYAQDQLVRVGNVSGCHRMDPVIHGFRPPHGDMEKVAVMDGFSLIVSIKLLDLTGGFERKLPPHHMYDNDICLESYNHGMENYVINMDAEHLGGRTDVGENWSEVFNKSKQEIHTEAHPIFYEKWKPGSQRITLPFYVQ